MKSANIIKRMKPVHLVHPWDRSRIVRKLDRKAARLYSTGAALSVTAGAFLALDCCLLVTQVALFAVMIGVVCIGGACVLGSIANRYDV